MSDPFTLKSTRWERRGRVGILTLDRPHRLNAWTGRMHAEVLHLLAEADDDPDVGAVVITGAGRAFCAGGDAEALSGHVDKGGYDAGNDPGELARPGYGVDPAFDADFASFFGLSIPVVAAVNGPAAGVGLALALFCDVRVAAEGAKLTTAHGKLNLPAEYGTSWILPRLVGLGRAMEIMLTSRVVTAEEAERIGLVTAVWPPDEVLDRAVAWTDQLLASVSPGSLATTRRQTYTDLHGDAASSVRAFRGLIDEMTTEADFAEGVAAWRERRPPQWTGR